MILIRILKNKLNSPFWFLNVLCRYLSIGSILVLNRPTVLLLNKNSFIISITYRNNIMNIDSFIRWADKQAEIDAKKLITITKEHLKSGRINTIYKTPRFEIFISMHPRNSGQRYLIYSALIKQVDTNYNSARDNNYLYVSGYGLSRVSKLDAFRLARVELNEALFHAI